MGKNQAKPVEQSVPEPLRFLDRDGELMLTVSANLASGYEQFLNDWNDCQRCPLYAGRDQVVFARGTLPADILFIGEAPGPVEDEEGFPFVGPSGRVLNVLVREVQAVSAFTYAIINTVGCVPWNNPDGEEKRFRVPERSETESCLPRFVQLFRFVSPKGVILLGKTAETFWERYRLEWKSQKITCPAVSICHPSYILRNGGIKEDNEPLRIARSGLKHFILRELGLGSNHK